MANNRPPVSPFYWLSRVPASLTLLLLATKPTKILAQLQHPPVLSSSTASPLAPADPTSGDTLLEPTSNILQAIPSSTDGAGYTQNSDETPSDRGILNYYFLLLTVFIIVVIAVYWSINRRRKKRINRLRDNQQSALARDLGIWPGHSRGGLRGRWRMLGANARVDEGLDERGEAPPPYLKEPGPAHLDRSGGVELDDMSREEGKPPDYEEGRWGRSL